VWGEIEEGLRRTPTLGPLPFEKLCDSGSSGGGVKVIGKIEQEGFLAGESPA